MSKRRDFTLHFVLRIYGSMFDHFEEFIKRLSVKQAEYKNDLLKALKAATHKLKHYYQKVTPRNGTLLLMATMLDPYQKLLPFHKWDSAEGCLPSSPDSFTSQHRMLFLRYFEVNYLRPIETHHDISTQDHGNTPASQQSGETTTYSKSLPGFGSDSEDEDLTAETRSVEILPGYGSVLTGGTYLKEYPDGCIVRTPGNVERKRYLDAAVDYINGDRLRKSAAHEEFFGRKAGNLNDLEEENQDPTRITVSWFNPTPDNFWRQVSSPSLSQHHQYLLPVEQMARDIYSCVPHGVGVESSFSIGRNVLSWKQSRMTASTLQSMIVTRQHIVNERKAFGRSAGQSKHETARDTMKRLNKLLCYTDYQHFTLAAHEMEKKRAGVESNSGKGFISGDEAEAKTWDNFVDAGEKFRGVTGIQRRSQSKKFTTMFTASQMLRKVNLNNPETDTEADASDEMSGDDNEHDFRHFTQDAGNDHPLQEQVLDDEEYNARDAAVSVPAQEHLDLTRSRAVRFDVVVMTRSSDQSGQPATRTKRLIPGDSESDPECTPRPHHQTSMRDFAQPPRTTSEQSASTPANKRSKSKGTAPSFPPPKITTTKRKAGRKGNNRASKALRKRDRVAGEMGSSDADSSSVSEEDSAEDRVVTIASPIVTRTTRATSRSAAESRSARQVRTRSRSLAGDVTKA